MTFWWLLLPWGALSFIQNASFTMTSRARNSGSDLYHGIAAVFSNGIWIVNIFFTLDVWSQARALGFWALVLAVTLYVVMTVSGSVTSAKLLRRYIEKGNRRVGAYNKGEGE